MSVESSETDDEALVNWKATIVGFEAEFTDLKTLESSMPRNLSHMHFTGVLILAGASGARYACDVRIHQRSRVFCKMSWQTDFSDTNQISIRLPCTRASNVRIRLNPLLQSDSILQ